MTWAARAALAAAMFLPLACSVGKDEPTPRRATGTAREVARVVQNLEQATRRHDWGLICTRLFTADARRRAGGRDCPRLLHSAGADVRRPRIELVAITVHGENAEAKVLTRAVGQPPIREVVQLRRERGSLRIDSLAG